jgi:hypothetical protein
MFTKEFEVNRKGEWLILTPQLHENIVTLSKIPVHKHIITPSDYFSLNSIIDLRSELKNNKFDGDLNFLFRFDDNEFNIPREQLYLEKIYIKALNRFKYNKDTLFYCNDFNNESNQYFYHDNPYNDGEIYLKNTILRTSSVPYDNQKIPNWIFTGPAMHLSYNTHLAKDWSGPIKKTSKNGWGFFRIAIKMPNTTYTPSKITALITTSEEITFVPYEHVFEEDESFLDNVDDNLYNEINIHDNTQHGNIEPPPIYEEQQVLA